MNENRYIMGTWQLSNDFGPRSQESAKGLLQAAWAFGIRHFDTASAYGQGTVETLLGETLPPEAFIITKVPGALYPKTPDVLFADCYSVDYFMAQVENSAQRLKHSPNVVLFHNWSPFWQDSTLVEIVAEIRQQLEFQYKARLGISLPNGFGRNLGDTLCHQISYVEAPANAGEPWLTPDYVTTLKAHKIEVILRSLFRQGMTVKSSLDMENLTQGDRRFSQRIAYDSQTPQNPAEVIRKALKTYDCTLVIGASTLEQIAQNLACFG